MSNSPRRDRERRQDRRREEPTNRGRDKPKSRSRSRGRQYSRSRDRPLLPLGERVVGEMTYVHDKGWGIIGDDVYWHISNVTAKLQQPELVLNLKVSYVREKNSGFKFPYKAVRIRLASSSHSPSRGDKKRSRVSPPRKRSLSLHKKRSPSPRKRSPSPRKHSAASPPRKRTSRNSRSPREHEQRRGGRR